MKIEKIVIIVDGQIEKIDTIDFEDRIRLVPNWRESPDRRTMKPLRIIGLAFAEGYSMKIERADALKMFQAVTITKALLNGLVPEGLEKLFEVRENPEISLPNPSALH